MPTPTPRLGDYRDKLTAGTVLGLSYKIHDPGYLVTRALPVQQLTVVEIRGDIVVFQELDGHQLRLGLHDRIDFLRFGPAPYDQAENILPLQGV